MRLAAGVRLGAYEVLSPLGRGGMGEVWRARDSRLGREVAIKVLPAELDGDPELLRRFEQEARAASSLNHPGLLTVHDVGREGDCSYLVTELLEGRTLREALGAGRLAPARAIAIAAELAAGLAAAHRKGIVHRDVKPENIFLTREGRVKILDFGLARLLPQLPAGEGLATSLPTVSRATEPGVVLGTVGYMAPEQVRGEPADTRADVFALGCVLYEMLSGRRPFSGQTSIETMSAILRDEPPPLDAAVTREAPAMEAVVRRCLEKDPSARFQSALDLEFTLGAIPLLARTEPGTAGGGVPVGRPRRIAMAVAVVAVVAVGSGILGSFVRGRRAPAPAEGMGAGTLEPLTTDPGYQGEPTFSPDGQTIAYVSDRDGNLEIYLQQVSGGPTINLTRNPAGDVQPSFSPDGRQIAFVSDREGAAGLFTAAPQLPLVGGAIWVMPALGGPSRRVVEMGNCPSWSPDGTTLVYSTGTMETARLAVVPAAGGAPRDIPMDPRPPGRFFWPRFSPDGRWILFQVGARIAVVPAAGGKPTDLGRGRSPSWIRNSGAPKIIFTSDEAGRSGGLWEAAFSDARGSFREPPHPVTFGPGTDLGASASPDGRTIAFAAVDQSLNLERLPFDAEAGRVTGNAREITQGENKLMTFDPSPSGDAVVFMASRGATSHLWRADPPAAAVQLTLDPAFEESAPAWSPAGDAVAFSRKPAAVPGAPAAVWLMRPDGGGARRITDFTGRSFAWLAEGRRLLVQRGEELDIVDVESGAQKPVGGVKVQSSFAVDQAGEWLAYQTSERGNYDIAVVSLRGGAPRTVVATPRQDFHPFFSPSGRWLYFSMDHKNVWKVPGPEQGWALAAPAKVTDFPENNLYVEEPRLARDGKTLFYTRGRTVGNIWILRRPASPGGAGAR